MTYPRRGIRLFARRVIIAISLTAICYGASASAGSAHHNNEQIRNLAPPPSGRSLSPELPSLSYAYPYKCDHPKSAEQDNLCIARRAADAAVVSAAWAERTYWVGLFGTIAVVATVIFTAIAAWASQRSAMAAEESIKGSDCALAQARDVSQRELRAYVYSEGFRGAVSIHGDEDARYVDAYALFTTYRNCGRTPAKEARTIIMTQKVPFQSGEVPHFSFEYPVDGALDVGPDMTVDTMLYFVPIDDLMEIWNRTSKIYVWTRVEYVDVHYPNRIRHAEKCALLDFMHTPEDIPPEGHPPYLRVIAMGPQNGSS